jgi:DNA gyrase/topoisomerase IV subunit B
MKYDSESIKTLEPLQHIRLRPGMYIPDVGIQGLHHLFEEVLNNSVDEYIAGYGNEIFIKIESLDNHDEVTIRDYGRGIPHEKLEDVFTKTLTGGKFTSDSYTTSSGLNGVGLKAVNALSKQLVVTSHRDSKAFVKIFELGKLTDESYMGKSPETGTEIIFNPDSSIFEVIRFDIDSIKNRLFMLASTLPNLRINLIANRENFVYFNIEPLISLQSALIGGNESIFEFNHHQKDLTIRLNYLQQSNSNIFSFVNTIHTYDNGSHVDVVYDALNNGLKKITGKTFSRNQLSQGLNLSVSIFAQFPTFRGQHKGSLADNKIKKYIYDVIYPELYKSLKENKSFTNYMVQLITAQEQVLQELDIKKAITNIKNSSKENRLPLKLAVAHNATPETRELFIVEGDSAAGSIKVSRNPKFQEVIPIKGKIINAFKSSYTELLNNKDVTDVFLAIGGVEWSNTPIRTKNVFIMSDSDPDGSHIISLLLSMFAIIFPSFIKEYNLYVVHSPLFSLISDDIRMFGHTIKEVTSEFKTKYGNKKYEIFRNKGLGELNPEEMAQFVNPNTRLVNKIILTEDSLVELEKLMGPLSDVRKHILENMQDDNEL